MTLAYFAGRRITGTATDRTGGTWTNLAAGWIFLETNTGLQYYWTGSAWVAVGGSGGIQGTESTITMRRTDAAGDQVIEFGPNQATGGASILDFHNDSADGDYRFRIIRNSGANGLLQMQQTGTGYFDLTNPLGGIRVNRGNVDSTAVTHDSLLVSQTLTTTPASSNPPIRAIFAQQFVTCSQLTNPFDTIGNTMAIVAYYSTADGATPAATPAKGSMNNISSVVDIFGSGSPNNEWSNYFGYQTARNGAQGSHWFTDWAIHGPIAAQPGFLNGITMIVNNYYDPAAGAISSRAFKAAVCNLVTMPGTGTGLDGAHAAARTYKMEIGLAIVGRSGLAGSTIDVGFDTGIQIGGYASGWMASSSVSRITKGITLNDIITSGIELLEPVTTNTGTGFKVNNATRAWDIFIDLSTGLAPNTAAIKLGLRPMMFSTMKIYEYTSTIIAVQSTVPEVVSIFNIMSGYTTAVTDTTVRSYLRIYATNSILNTEFLQISIEGTNGAVFSTRNQGTGTVRGYVFRIFNTDILTFNNDNTVNFNSRTINNAVFAASKIISYEDSTAISAPADPASGTTRRYTKTVDANNDGIFVKRKVNGAAVEVQL